MPQNSGPPATKFQLLDSDATFGWASIVLHWITAIIVVALWYFGKSIFNGPPEESDAMRGLHVSLAASAWLIIFARSIWRLRSGHPRAKGQSVRIHRIAKLAHYIMLLVLGLMLLSGPLLVWSGENSISVFGWLSIPSPLSASEALREFAWFIHSNSSMVLLALVLLHIGGALKHLMFHSDDTIARMIWPGRRTAKKGES